MQISAPTSSQTDQEIEDFYQELGTAINSSPKSDIMIVQGDWNAKIGPDAYAEWAGTAGKFGWAK